MIHTSADYKLGLNLRGVSLLSVVGKLHGTYESLLLVRAELERC